jgi:hypothetical protein
LPRSKEALREAINGHRDFKGLTPDLWPADFRYGDHLVMRADGDGITARVVEKLRDAVQSGTLGIGRASGVFQTGLFFMTPGMKPHNCCKNVLTGSLGKTHKWPCFDLSSANSRPRVIASSS